MRGGNRAGGGRKRGPNYRTRALRHRLDKLLPDDKLIKILITLAEGESRQVYDARNDEFRVVKDRGDGRVATWLGERKWGKLPQPIQGDSDSPPVTVRVISDNRLGVKP